jgi:hypothetical protein
MKSLFILLLGLSLVGCQNLWSGKNKKHADMVQLYMVDATPTAPNMQSADKNYVLDFAVLKPVDLSPDEAAALYTAMEDTENFTAENRKRCPFIGQYAVEVAGEFVAVISSSPCSKVQMREDDEKQIQYLELVENNGVEAVLGSRGAGIESRE